MAVVGSGSVGGGTVVGSALRSAAGAFVPAPATATAPAPEEVEPASDSSVGSVERHEGEAEWRRGANGAVDCAEAGSGACGVLERLSARGGDGSCGEDAIRKRFAPFLLFSTTPY